MVEYNINDVFSLSYNLSWPSAILVFFGLVAKALFTNACKIKCLKYKCKLYLIYFESLHIAALSFIVGITSVWSANFNPKKKASERND